jgi:hypothetical protein
MGSPAGLSASRYAVLRPRPVRRAMHPARTVRNAVTPRPVKQPSRAAYMARHPVGAGENKLIEATLYPQGARRRKRGFGPG